MLIYRFGGALFFANANTIKDEIDDLVTDDMKAVIIDASGITSIDVTAVERLMILYTKYKRAWHKALSYRALWKFK